MPKRKKPTESRNQKNIQIVSLLERGQSYEKICTQLNIGKDRIRNVKNIIIENHLTSEQLREMNDHELDCLFDKKKNHVEQKRESIYEEPDYEYLSKELMKSGVTRQLLWEEYRDDCYLRNTVPYQLTQFKVKLNDYIRKQPYASLIVHQPGCLIEVDWTGDKARWFDPDTGEEVFGWLFVGVLSFSGLAYAEVFSDMREGNWIKAHTNMFLYFHGVTPTLRCDNLKTGVLQHPKNANMFCRKTIKVWLRITIL